MNLKTFFATILVVFSITIVNAQSKDILAKSAMLNADEAYANGQYSECLGFLKDAETNLGITNSRIQYLKVKSLMALGTNDQYNKTIWSQAETELKIFFEVTPENGYVPEKYDEMILAVGKVKKSISYAEAYEGKDVSELKKCDAAIERDPTNSIAYFNRAWAKYKLKDYQGSIQDNSKCVELDPSYKYAYFNRALAQYFLKYFQGAIQDYSKCIEIDPNYIAAYFQRGMIYQNNLNDIQAAKVDFKKVISNDGDLTSIAYSFFYLGEKEKAFKTLNNMLEEFGDDPKSQMSIYYDLACLYSIDGNLVEAIASLKNALEKGYSNFWWIVNDKDLDNIRNSSEFKELINTYKK